jgi:hypothetical protein
MLAVDLNELLRNTRRKGKKVPERNVINGRVKWRNGKIKLRVDRQQCDVLWFLCHVYWDAKWVTFIWTYCTCMSREKENVSHVMEFCFTQVLFCYMHSGMYLCDTERSAGPESANSMLSLRDPQDGMFIVSCWSLSEAGPLCLARCMLLHECLSSFF